MCCEIKSSRKGSTYILFIRDNLRKFFILAVVVITIPAVFSPPLLIIFSFALILQIEYFLSRILAKNKQRVNSWNALKKDYRGGKNSSLSVINLNTQSIAQTNGEQRFTERDYFFFFSFLAVSSLMYTSLYVFT